MSKVIKKEDTSAKKVIGNIKNVEDIGSTSTIDVKIGGTDTASKPDVKAEVKTEVKKEEPTKEAPKKEEKKPEVFGKDRFEEVYSNTPKITIGKKNVEINLVSVHKEFDSGMRGVEVFKCAGQQFKFKIDKTSCVVFDVKDQAVANAVARSLLAMSESSTNSTE